MGETVWVVSSLSLLGSSTSDLILIWEEMCHMVNSMGTQLKTPSKLLQWFLKQMLCRISASHGVRSYKYSVQDLQAALQSKAELLLYWQQRIPPKFYSKKKSSFLTLAVKNILFTEHFFDILWVRWFIPCPVFCFLLYLFFFVPQPHPLLIGFCMWLAGSC